MAVPKKKTAKSRSAVRHTTYINKERKRLVDQVNVVTCKECSAPKQAHTMCSECGCYGKKKIIVKKEKEVTTIKV